MNLEERTENKETKYSYLGAELLRQNDLKPLKLISLITGTVESFQTKQLTTLCCYSRKSQQAFLRLSQKAFIMVYVN